MSKSKKSYIEKGSDLTHHMRRQELGVYHSVSIKTIAFATFRRILKVLCVEWRNSTPRFELLPKKKGN